VIIPRPTTLTSAAPGTLRLPAELNLRVGPGAERPAALLADHLGADRPRTRQGPEIRLELTAAPGPAQSYRLAITEDALLLTAPDEAGLFHGVQSVRQLLAADPSRLPCVTVEDAPLLPWRGLMIDVARHFMPLAFLYELVEELAALKLNVLHLHLTDDQGWRIEIDGRPRLTEIGAWRTESMIGPAGSDRFDGVPHGGYYTRAELAGLVAHAAGRGVRVVPEIELPGHARAALAAYPELGVHGKALPVWTSWGVCEDVFGVHDAAFGFLREVLDQTVDLFPDRYVHLGGDECPTVQWETDPYSRRKAAALGLPSPAALHGWMLTRMNRVLAELGRSTISWDNGSPEELGRPTTDLVLAAWLDPDHALRSIGRGHRVLVAPHQSTFFDYPQHDHPNEPQGQPGRVTTLEDAYAFDPLRADGTGRRPSVVDPFDTGDPRPGVLGAQAQLWTEFLPTPAEVRYAAYPRLHAFAEAVWSCGKRDFADFADRLARLHPAAAADRPAPRAGRMER
jgi:hexosaminidase